MLRELEREYFPFVSVLHYFQEKCFILSSLRRFISAIPPPDTLFTLLRKIVELCAKGRDEDLIHFAFWNLYPVSNLQQLCVNTHTHIYTHMHIYTCHFVVNQWSCIYPCACMHVCKDLLFVYLLFYHRAILERVFQGPESPEKLVCS